MTVIR